MAEVKIGDSTSGQELSLFVRMEIVQKGGELGYAWYKLSETHKESNVLSPSFNLTQPDCHYLSAQVAVGRFLFVIGGTDFQFPGRYKKRYKDVFFMDTQNPEGGWKKGPKILTSRAAAYTFVLGDTICLFGGSLFNYHPYGEVLDLKTGIWKSFKYPIDSPILLPRDVYGHGILFYKAHKSFPDRFVEAEHIWYEYLPHEFSMEFYPKHIYLDDSKALYCYNFKAANWKRIEKPHPSSPAYQTSASVDDILYALCPNSIKAYSMTRGMWFDDPVSGFDKCLNVFPPTDTAEVFAPPSLVHLGNGLLCILWVKYGSPTYNLLHCTKFTVNVEMTIDYKISAAAVVNLSRTYKLPAGIMVDCVAVSASSTITFPFVESSCEVDLGESSGDSRILD